MDNYVSLNLTSNISLFRDFLTVACNYLKGSSNFSSEAESVVFYRTQLDNYLILRSSTSGLFVFLQILSCP